MEQVRSRMQYVPHSHRGMLVHTRQGAKHYICIMHMGPARVMHKGHTRSTHGLHRPNLRATLGISWGTHGPCTGHMWVPHGSLLLPFVCPYTASVSPPLMVLCCLICAVAHRYTWRRGSVPLWWSVTIRNGGMGEAEIKIHNTNTFRGSRR